MSSVALSVVIPTYNRALQVYNKALAVLMDDNVGELIIVVDGSTDDTVSRLERVSDPRLKVICNSNSEGPSAARNTGIALSTGAWVALLDDDDFHSDGFFAELLRVATATGAGIVGTAWLHLRPEVDPESGFETAQRGDAGPDLSSPSIVPTSEWVDCLWLPLNVLARRSVLEAVNFDEGYVGNFWREETDFFVSAVKAGHKVVATNRAYSYQYEKPAGGIRRGNRFIYEYWVIRNNIRFMWRHGAWLSREGYINGRWSFVVDSATMRLKPLIVKLIRKSGGKTV